MRVGDAFVLHDVRMLISTWSEYLHANSAVKQKKNAKRVDTFKNSSAHA